MRDHADSGIGGAFSDQCIGILTVAAKQGDRKIHVADTHGTKPREH